MVGQTYICKVCGKTGDNESALRKHEKIPITGLELEVGQVYRHMGCSPDYLVAVVVLDPAQINAKHERNYNLAVFCITKDKKGIESSFIQPVRGEIGNKLLGKFSPEEFKVVSKVLKKESYIKDLIVGERGKTPQITLSYKVSLS